MDLENICPIVDTVTYLRIHDKRGVLRDLARRAARTRNVDDDVIFNALLKREELG
jgi:mannitol/fructose-specific phosphotransferase system IIA component (Ntr-type)